MRERLHSMIPPAGEHGIVFHVVADAGDQVQAALLEGLEHTSWQAVPEGGMHHLADDVRVGANDLCAGADDQRVRASYDGVVLVGLCQ